MKNKKLSIVIPFYNVEAYFRECLDSIVKDYDVGFLEKNIEVVLVDDCGADKSHEIAKEYARNFNFISLLEHDVNKGLGGARNTGVKNTSGEYIQFIDSDDYLIEGALNKIINWLRHDKEHEKSIHIFGFIAKKNNKRVWGYVPEMEKTLDTVDALTLYSEDKISSSVCNKIFPRTIISENLFSENLYYEDLEFTPIIFSKAKKVYLHCEELYVYRQDGSSITRQATKRKHVEDLIAVLETLWNSSIDRDIRVNFYFDRWAYLLSTWTMDASLASIAFNSIANFVEENDVDIENKTIRDKFFASIDKVLHETSNAVTFELVNRLLIKLNSYHEVILEGTEKSKYSIIIPIHNAEHYINRLLDSLKKMNPDFIQVVLVDDCSQDRSLELIRAYEGQLKNLTIITTKYNAGPGNARNIGLKYASGDFVLFLDSDDDVDSLLIERLNRISNIRNHDVIVYSFSVYEEGGKFLWTKQSIRDLNGTALSGRDAFKLISSGKINPAPWNKVFNKNLFHGSSDVFPQYIHNQDLAMIPLFLARARSVYLLGEDLYKYFVNPNAVTQTVSDKHIISTFYALLYLEAHLDFNTIDVSQFRELAFDNINYNLKLRKSEMTKYQYESFIKKFNAFSDFFHPTTLMSSEKVIQINEILLQGRSQHQLLEDVDFGKGEDLVDLYNSYIEVKQEFVGQSGLGEQ